MSKEQIAFWSVGGLNTRVNAVETRTQLNEENIILLNEQVGELAVAVFPQVYGSFSSTETQSIPDAGTGTALTYDTVDIANECSLVGDAPTPLVIVSHTGVYRVLFSIQLNRTGGSFGTVFAYPVVGGTPVPNSTTKMSINNNQEDCLTVEFILSLTADVLFGINCYSPSAGQEALAIPATAEYPATPSIILTLNRIA
jgi:hypothetical protein